jgi:hypothetical protein
VTPLWDYVREREHIRLRRLAGQPFPWTDDPALREWRFTNVRRIHDRTTQAFLAIYKEHRHALAAVALYNCALYRWFGTVEFATKVGWLEVHDEQRIHDAHRRCEAPWTSAYVIAAGPLGTPKWKTVVLRLERLWHAAPAVTNVISIDRSWRLGFDVIRALPGFGGTGFMAKEVLQDYLLWFAPLTVEDAYTWTPVGPGARRGLNRLAGRRVGAYMHDAPLLTEIRTLQAEVNLFWQKEFPSEPLLTAHDIQFCCCEWDKLCRAREGGRPKRRYTPPLAFDPKFAVTAEGFTS